MNKSIVEALRTVSRYIPGWPDAVLTGKDSSDAEDELTFADLRSKGDIFLWAGDLLFGSHSFER